MSLADSFRSEARAVLAAGTDSYEDKDFPALGEVRGALGKLVQTLQGIGFTSVSGPGDYLVNPALRALRDAVRKAAFAAPVVVVYYTGHGCHPDQDHYYLVGEKSRPADFAGTAFPATELLTQLMRRDDRGELLDEQPLVLVILDCCYSGSAGREMLGEALRGIGNRQTWVIASAGTLETAQQGLFARAFCDALERPATGPSQRFVSLDSLVQAVNDANVGHAEQQARVFPPPTGSTGIPPFFPNRNFRPGLAGLTVDEQHWLSRVRGGPEDTTTGSYLTGKEGRIQAAEQLATWIANPGSGKLAIVTGSPGTGKSALLSLPVLLTQPTRRNELLRTTEPGSLVRRTADLLPVSTPLVAVHARGLNTDQAAGIVAQALGQGHDVGSAATLLEHLDANPVRDNWVVVVDAVDEATSPATLLRSLVLPLARHPGLRVVVGARRHVLPDAAHADLIIDLDASQFKDPQALSDYVQRLLMAAEEPGVTTPYQASAAAPGPGSARDVAAAIARRVIKGGLESFLLGRLFALSVRDRAEPVDITSADWRAELPASIAETFDHDLARLGGKQRLAQALLTALTWAKGPGLPWENIWTVVAREIAELDVGAGLSAADAPITDDDVRWLLTKAGAYIVEDLGPGERSVYRPFHDLFAAHLRGEPSTEQRDADPPAAAAWEERRRRIEAAITGALIATVPARAQGQPDWLVAHPYLRTYLAQHAAAAGTETLAELVQDMDFLAVADPITLTPLLSPAVPELREAARIYRRAQPQLESDVSANAGYLHEASRALTGITVVTERSGIEPLYRTHLASVRKDDSLLTITGHTSSVTSVAFGATSQGQLLLASGSKDGTVRLWDPVTGAAAAEPFTGRADSVRSVAFGTTAEGRLVLASSGKDRRDLYAKGRTARRWNPFIDVAAGDRHTGLVTSVAFGTTAEGHLLLASGGRDRTVRIQQPFSIQRPFISAAPDKLLAGHTEEVTSVAFGSTGEGRLLLASGSDDGTVRVWDPVAGAAAGEPVTDHTEEGMSVAFGSTPEGRLLLASGTRRRGVQVWDVVTAAAVGKPLTGYTDSVRSVAFGSAPEGRLLLAFGGWSVQVRDAITGAVAGYFGGWRELVTSVAFGRTGEGRLLLAYGTRRGTVRICEQGIGYDAGQILTGHTKEVTSVAFGRTGEGRLLIASASKDGTVRVRDSLTGGDVGGPLTGHTSPVTSVAFGTTGEGRLLLISASVDKTVRWWDTTASKCVLTLRRRSGVRSIGVSGALLAIGDDEGISVIEPRFECFPLRPLR